MSPRRADPRPSRRVSEGAVARDGGASRLAATLRDAPVIRINGYDYFVHPITDGIPRVDPDLLDEVAGAIAARLPKDFDVILTAEAMGIPLASVLSLRIGKPFTVARKRSYGLPDEVVVDQRTGYGSAHLHVHGLHRGDRVVVVDDVVSTGGTLRALAEACRTIRAQLLMAFVAINKAQDLAALGRELGCPVECLVRIRIERGRVQLEAT